MDTVNTMVNLSKGQRVDLTKGTNIKNVMVALGWEVKRYSGGEDHDLDVSLFLLDTDGKAHNVEDIIFYNNPATKDGSIVHSGDDRKGGTASKDIETILVSLDKVNAKYQRLAFTVTIDEADKRKQNFGQIGNAFIRIVDTDTNKELLRYDLGEEFSNETAVVAGELYRSGSDWKFNAVGAGFNGGLAALVRNYGLSC